jgi:hypothetical protein
MPIDDPKFEDTAPVDTVPSWDDTEDANVKKKVSTTESQPSSNQKSPSESVGKEDISKSAKKSGKFKTSSGNEFQYEDTAPEKMTEEPQVQGDKKEDKLRQKLYEKPRTVAEFNKEFGVKPEENDQYHDKILQPDKQEDLLQTIDFKRFLKQKNDEQSAFKPEDSYFWGFIHGINKATSKTLKVLDGGARIINDLTGISYAGTFDKAANIIDEDLKNTKHKTPSNIGGMVTEGIGSMAVDLPLMMLAPETKLSYISAATGGVIKTLPGLIPYMAATNALSTYQELDKQEHPEANKLTETLKALGTGATEGLAMETFGFLSSKAGGFVKGVTDSNIAGKVASAVSNGTLFGGMTGAEQFMSGKVNTQEIISSSILGAGMDVLMGKSLKDNLETNQQKASDRFFTSSPEEITKVNDIPQTVEELRQEQIKVQDNADKEANPQKKEELQIASGTLDGYIDLKAISKQVISNPDAAIKAIENDPKLSDEEKKYHIDKINEVVAKNDPRLQAIDPMIKESANIDSNIQNIKSNEHIPEENKAILIEGLEDKKKSLENDIKKEMSKPVDIFELNKNEQLKSKENEKAKRSNGNKGNLSTVETVKGERGEKETVQKEVDNAKEVRSDKEIPVKEGKKSEIGKDVSGENLQLGKEAGAKTSNPEEGHEVIPAFVPEGMGEPEPSGTKSGQVEIGEKTKTPNAMKKILSTGDKNVFSREIKKDGKDLGEVHVEEKPEGWEVKYVMVNDKGKGYGKQIYRELNKQAQAEDKVIKSDRPDKISGAAKGLWDSLVKSGEAEKLPDNSYKMLSEKLAVEKPIEAKIGDQIGFKDMVGTDRKGEILSIEDGKYKIKAEDGTTYRVKQDKLQLIEQAEKNIKESEAPAESETKLNEKIKSSKATLAKESIPVLSGLVKEVVKPVAETVKDAFSIAAKFLSPKSFASERVKDILNETLIGDRNESKSKLDIMLRPMEKIFDQLPNEDNVKFIDNLKTGKDQGSQELNEMANLIRKLDVDLYKKITEFNPNLTFKEDHYRVLWKVIPQSPEFAEIVKDFNSGKTVEEIAKERNLTNDEVDYTVKRSTQKGFKGLGKKPLRGTRGFFKQSTLSDISEGIALGGVPKSYNPITMFKMSYADGMKYITAQNMWKTLGESNLTKFVKQGDVAPERFEKINDNISKKYFPIKEQGEWWVDEGAARLINNHLSKDYIRSTELGKGLMWLKNNFTAIELGLSAFHATAETMETISSSIGEGLRKTINLGIFGGEPKKILEGLADIPKSIITPYTKAKVAGEAMKFIMNEKEYINTPEGKSFIKKFPDAANLIHDYFVGGGTIGMHDDYKINSIKALRESLKEKSDDPAYKYIKAGVMAIPAMNERAMSFLFDKYIPRLKLGMFLREQAISLVENQKRLEKGTITRTELARRNMAFVDDRLGEMNFDNLFWDRTFKTSMQFMFRSVTWKLGNLRAMGGAPIEQAIEFRNAFRENRSPILQPKMAWLFGMTVMQVAAASLLQGFMAKKKLKDFKDVVSPQINENDEKERLVLPTYFKDMLHFYHSPVKYVTGSFAGDIGRFYELQQNKDFFGYEIYDPQAPASEKAKEIGEYFLPKPFSFTNLAQMKAKDEGLVKQSLSFLGFTKAPKYITNTPIENEIGDMYNMTNSLKKPHNAKEVSDVKGKIKELYKNGKEDEAYRLMTKSVSEGKLRATQTDWLLRNIDKKADPGEYMFRMLPYDDKKYLYNKMTDDEKTKYDPKETLKGQIKSENKPEGFGNNAVYYKYEKITSQLNSAQKEIDSIIKKKGSDAAVYYAKKHKISNEYSFVKENSTKLEELRRVIEYVKKLSEDEQKEYQPDIEEVMDEVTDAFKSGEKIKLNSVVNKLHREIMKDNKGTRKEERETLKELD